MDAKVQHGRFVEALTTGVPEKGMPGFALPEHDIEAVRAFLGWLGGQGARVRAGFEAAAGGSSGSLSGLPWFEYPALRSP